MLPGDEEKLNKIENLKNKLFDVNYKVRFEHRDSFPHFQEKEVVDSWNKKEDSDSGFGRKLLTQSSLFKKFFIFSVGFFILAMGYAGYTFFSENNTISGNNIDISVKSNAFTAGGEEYSLLLEITNGNNAPLNLVDLVIEYPKNSNSDSSQDNEHLRVPLGTIPAFGTKNENVKLILFGEQGSKRTLRISLEYRVEGSNAIFVKERSYDISINSTPVNFSFDIPPFVSSNQDIRFSVKTVSNTNKMISKMLVKIDYPIGFQFLQATPSPSFGNNIWNLGDIAPGAGRDITIQGRMVDVFDGEEKVFRVWGGSQSPTDKYLIGTMFNSLEHLVLVKRPSVEARLLINGVSSREYAIDTKTAIRGEIEWKNNLETKINNLEIRAKISGNAVDRKSIVAEQGFYDSAHDLITWDKNFKSGFKEISPGDSGVVAFSFSALPLFGGTEGIISAPVINIELSLFGESAENGGVAAELGGKEFKVVKIISDVGILAKVFHYSGPLKNTGPIPPKVEQKTTYTVSWSVSNTANNISNAEVRSSIPPWINFTGLFLPATEDLVYNPATREIIWTVGGINSGTGISAGMQREISFQLSFSPSLSQLNTIPVILNDTVLTGRDDFANVDIKARKASLNTGSLSDAGSSVTEGKVVE